MFANTTQRLLMVSLVSLLLIAWGLISLFRSFVNTFQTRLSIEEAWPLLAGSLISSLFSAGVTIAAGLMLLGQHRWGWKLAGVVLCWGIIGSIIGGLQQVLIKINGEPLYTYTQNPWLFYSNIVIAIVYLCLLFLLYMRPVRKYGNEAGIKTGSSLLLFFGFGCVLLLVSASFPILGSVLTDVLYD